MDTTSPHIPHLPPALHRAALGLLLTVLCGLCAHAMPALRFSHMDVVSGLASDSVLSGYQLTDGRMMFLTAMGVDLYDGASFHHFTPDDRAHRASLPGYTGATHLYADRHHRLWIKNQGEVRCFDILRERYMDRPDVLLRETARRISGKRQQVIDMFTDEQSRYWLVTPGGLWSEASRRRYALPTGDVGALQDLWCDDTRAYLFFSHGIMAAYDVATARLLYTTQAYPAALWPGYEWTSVTARTPQGVLIQVRVGTAGSICMAFDPAKRTWRTLLTGQSPNRSAKTQG